MESRFQYLNDFPQPFWLALLPEGTRFTRAKLAAAQEYAAATGLHVHRNVLIPHKKVSISYEEQKAVYNKGIGRKIIDKLDQTYSSELAGKRFAYDGEKSLYTVGPLPQNKMEFTVVLEKSLAKRLN